MIVSDSGYSYKKKGGDTFCSPPVKLEEQVLWCSKNFVVCSYTVLAIPPLYHYNISLFFGCFILGRNLVDRKLTVVSVKFEQT